jgi:7,8-dihydropterin-6-yl-methyl-4-(beta-D-ribofuranosyl)aminobenzene 5'-phosphate synthase
MVARAVGLALLLIACQRPPVEAAPRPVPVAPGNRILNLFDAFGPKIAGTRHAFGFSALVRYEGKTILFDAGSSADILKENARALGVDLSQVDFAVASHSHFDHISGFDYLLEVNPKVKIYFPADIYWGAPFEYDASGPEPAAAERLPKEQRYFSGESARFQWSSSGRFWKANVEFVGRHTDVAPGVHLIATRSPFVGYFSRYPAVGGHGHFKGPGETKLIELPELSLSLDTTEGEVLIVGCSHSLVDVIARETKAHLKRDVHLVLGGFHLLPYGADEIREMARRLREEIGVQNVAPTHCTGHLGFGLFQEAYGEHYHLAGLGSSVPFPRAR